MKSYLMAFLQPVAVEQGRTTTVGATRVTITSSENLSQMEPGKWVKIAESREFPTLEQAHVDLGVKIRQDRMQLTWWAQFLTLAELKELRIM